jgi:hypothetical protein
VADGSGLGLAAGFYIWMIGPPHQASSDIFRTSQPGLLTGLTPTLAITIGVGLAVAALLSLTPAARVWRTRLSLASSGLYAAALVAIAGPGASAAGAALALLALVALVVRNDIPQSGATLVALHVGALSTAIAFFEQWPWYGAGWRPFLENLSALRILWLGS